MFGVIETAAFGPFRSQALRDAANGAECTLHIAGVCNYDPATTVLAHFPDESHGMGRKSDDLSAGFACSSCHDAIDGRTPHNFDKDELEWYMRRSQTRTIRLAFAIGIFQ